MNPQLKSALDECLVLCRRLEGQLEWDMVEIRRSMTGEVLEAYLESSEAARQQLTEIKKQLTILHASASSAGGII